MNGPLLERLALLVGLFLALGSLALARRTSASRQGPSPAAGSARASAS